MKYYVVDAFANQLFKGNPAGVCILDEYPDAAVMQAIAAENNLAETAFVVRRDGYYDLRWFTPEVEMDLCGHATLASAFVVAHFVDPNAARMDFHTRSGVLSVAKVGALYEMDFPSRKPVRATAIDPAQVGEALGAAPLELWQSRDLLVLVESAEQVRALAPDFERLKRIPDCFAVIVTARSDAVTAKGEKVDFVSRFFAPNAGIAEDPVTGSAHSTLIPFWAERLDKSVMVAQQLSSRGGTLYCQDCGERVKISGEAVLYLTGEIHIA